MERQIIFDIECGETTCASEPGEFCRFLQYNPFGDDGSCYFFGKVFDKDGWIQRHPECLKMTGESSQCQPHSRI